MIILRGCVSKVWKSSHVLFSLLKESSCSPYEMTEQNESHEEHSKFQDLDMFFGGSFHPTSEIRHSRSCLSFWSRARQTKGIPLQPFFAAPLVGFHGTFSTSSARWQTQDTHALAVATSTRGMCQCDGDGTFRAVVSINRLQGKTVATGPRGPLQVDPLLVVCSSSSNYDMIQYSIVQPLQYRTCSFLTRIKPFSAVSYSFGRPTISQY